ncbi:MAG: glutamate 5-kinase [Candidatus Omnitrophica bacterium]|nr:glutamate 5-kinase [Candidatus Omnitrophota bacterium]
MKRIVIKIGTKVLTGRDGRLDEEAIRSLVGQISKMLNSGIEVLIVSSGAIGAGMGILKMKKLPESLAELQAIASIGQTALMNVYNKYFVSNSYFTGQILLTQDDFDDRARYLNIKYTINTLISHRAVPIINENDTIRTDEIKCGDNDRISSLVADLSGADALIMLTDVDGLLDEEGKCIKEADAVTGKISSLVKNTKKTLGTGGMQTKVMAAEFCVNSGIECYIANGKRDNVLLNVIDKKGSFTHFRARAKRISAKKRWIGFGSKAKGALIVDDGAKEALLKHNKSLLSAGISEMSGQFCIGDIVKICDKRQKEFARGISNYSSEEILRIKGRKTQEIETVLGYKDHDEVIHRDNLIIIENSE